VEWVFASGYGLECAGIWIRWVRAGDVVLRRYFGSVRALALKVVGERERGLEWKRQVDLPWFFD
jgi:hypothetical protein